VKIYESTFVRQVFTIFSGGVVAQIIPFLVEPLLTRIYTPEEFALFAQFISFTTLFTIVATARYELAIMLPNTLRLSVNILALSFIISFITSVVSVVIIAIFGKHIVKFLNNEPLLNYLWLSPFAILFAGMFQALNYWMLRNKRFGMISINRVFQTILNSFGNILLGFMKFKALGLILSFLFAQILSFLLYLFHFIRKDKRSISLINKVEIKEMAIQYSDFPKINSLHAFIDVFQQSIVIFLLSYFFLFDDVGYYSRTYRLLMAPVSLLGASIGQVFFQRASQYYSDGKSIHTIVVKTLRNLAIVAIPIFFVLALFAPMLFEWFLGEGWSRAGVMARFICPWVMFSFIISPVSTIPIILGQQRKSFVFSLIGNSLIVLSILIGAIFFHDIYISLLIVSITMSVYFIILLFWFLKISSDNNK